MIGLQEALSSFVPDKGVAFSSFASHRIKGAMLDDLRRQDWLTRDDRAAKRRAEAAEDRATRTLGRKPADSDIAAEMGIELSELRAVQLLQSLAVVSIEDFATGGDYLDAHVSETARDPLTILLDRERDRMAAEAIAALPERDREALIGRLEQGLSLAESGANLGVSGSRACQIVASAVRSVRKKLAPESLPKPTLPVEPAFEVRPSLAHYAGWLVG